MQEMTVEKVIELFNSDIESLKSLKKLAMDYLESDNNIGGWV